MKVCVLASGSRGNATYLETDDTRLLIDAGISARAITTKLSEIGVEPATLTGILISHEHGDHVNGVRVLGRRHKLPVWINRKTFNNIKHDWSELEINFFRLGKKFKINSLTVKPFYVPHDAVMTSAFVIQNGEKSLGIATDLGDYTNLLIQNFKDCSAIVLESNYEDRLLMQSKYPWEIKQRIRGKRGHLSNKRSFEAIINLQQFKKLKFVLLAHISQENNSEESIRNYIKRHPDSEVRFLITTQDEISEFITL